MKLTFMSIRCVHSKHISICTPKKIIFKDLNDLHNLSASIKARDELEQLADNARDLHLFEHKFMKQE